MEQIINILIKSISRYELLNNLIPGIILCFILEYIGYEITNDDWLTNIVIYYFAGLVNGRISSVVLEFLCKKISFIDWRSYSSYNNAKNKRSNIVTLQEIANMYRSLASVFMIALSALLYRHISNYWFWLDNNCYWIIWGLLFVLFLFSYRKQVKYVTKIIDEVENDEKPSN